MLRSTMATASPVALLAEGVGRNNVAPIILVNVLDPSPSSRRAWVEIPMERIRKEGVYAVALLAEGVGRNVVPTQLCAGRFVALLAEGVGRNSMWNATVGRYTNVALLAEGVGRNELSTLWTTPPHRSPSSRRAWVEITLIAGRVLLRLCRPPRGGRG